MQDERTIASKLSEGNIYRTISHSISVLKQIRRICDCALDNPEYYPDIEYYEKLRNTVDETMALINKSPINTEDFE